MSATPIIGSSNISLLDSRLVADLCVGTFLIDASPSNFIGSGAANVSGIKVKVTNPFGAIIKDYGAGYDATPGSSGGVIAAITVNIPTKAGSYQYGVYTFALQLTDQNGTSIYEVIKTQNICPYPDEKNVCQDSVEMVADCQGGKLHISMAEAPTYQTKLPQSKTQSWTIHYPTASGMPSESATVGNFSVALFEGVYKLTGSVCVTYAMGDNIFVSLGSTGSWEKNVKCIIDYSCIEPRLEKLGKDLDKACNDKDRSEINNTIFSVLWLLTKIQIRLGAGNDASDDISLLETILGCSCTCDCNASSPIINSTPSSNIIIEGCNVAPQVIGLTTHYTINAYNYIVSVDPNQAVITITAPALSGCTKTQAISLNLPLLYTQIKNQIASNVEYSFWGGVISSSLIGVDASCLGLTSTQWGNLSFQGKIQAVINKICSDTGSCGATVTGSVAKNGTDAVFTFAMVAGYYLEIYVDMVLRGTVLAGSTTFTVPGVANGVLHQYVLIPRCQNGDRGIPYASSFQYLACPDIEPISVSSNNVNGVACPYNLTALVAALPAGITAVWHTANNTNANTLVGNPAAVNSGVYYGFAKNVDNCYSIGVQVQVICAAASDCSEPQNLAITYIGGGALVQFQSAAFPPPANSYTVKRRLSSDPDVSGSYTTIGTPSFNSTSGRWEILDASAFFYTLYSYKAISNCASTSPSVQALFAFGVCGGTTLTPTIDTIGYTVAGSILPSHQVKFLLYNSDGTILLQTATLTTTSLMHSGTFLYLTPNTTYQIKTDLYLGSYLVSHCNTTIVTTLAADNIHIENNISGLTLTETSVGGGSYFTISSGALPLTNGQAINGKFSSFGGVIQITVSGTYAAIVRAGLYLDGVLQQCIDIGSPGIHTFSNAYYSSGQQMEIILSAGSTCAP